MCGMSQRSTMISADAARPATVRLSWRTAVESSALAAPAAGAGRRSFRHDADEDRADLLDDRRAGLAGGMFGFLRLRPDFTARTRVERMVMLGLLAASLVAGTPALATTTIRSPATSTASASRASGGRPATW